MRRMPGEGSIYKRVRLRPPDPEHPDRPRKEYVRWVAQVSHGPRHDRHVVRRVRRTRGEARKALEELLAPRRATPSLGAYLRSWLDETAAPSLAPNTVRGYRAAIASLEAIHDVPLADLTPEDVESAINRLTAQRKGQEKPVPASPKTRKNALALLRTALRTAVERGLVPTNVALLVKPPRVPREPRQALTPEAAKAVLGATARDRYAAAYALGLCGLRLSEVLGLAWRDVDLEAGTVDVRWQVVGSGKGARRAQLKTRDSEAPIAIPPFVVALLEAHRRGQAEERPFVAIDGDGLVFVTKRGYAVNGSWLTKRFGDILVAAKLPRMRFHDLRHGAASLLVAAGAHPRVAQALLRHSTSRMTMEVYAHTTAAQERQAADMLEAMLGEPAPGASRRRKRRRPKRVLARRDARRW